MTDNSMERAEILVTSDDEVNRRPVNVITLIYREADVSIPIHCEFLDTGAITYYPSPRRFHHRHPHYTRMFLFERGGAEIEAGDSKLFMVPGAVYLLPANQEFHITYTPCDLYFFKLLIHDSTGISVFDRVEGVPYLEGADRLFAEIIASFATGQTVRRQMLVMEAVFEFCQPLFEALRDRTVRTGRYEEILAYVQQNVSASTKVEEIAARFGMSRHSLSKGLERTLGMSLKGYISEMLMSKAKRLLLSTSKTAEEIAFDLDFTEPSYFYRAFKRLTGYTPGEFRRLR